LIFIYRSKRITEGILKLKVTAWISRSCTSTISTFPWHHSVTAFCQWTILSGSYVAFSSNVCSITLRGYFDLWAQGVSRRRNGKRLDEWQLAALSSLTLSADSFRVQFRNLLGTLALAAVTAACASTGATPRPFPVPGGSLRVAAPWTGYP